MSEEADKLLDRFYAELSTQAFMAAATFNKNYNSEWKNAKKLFEDYQAYKAKQ